MKSPDIFGATPHTRISLSENESNPFYVQPVDGLEEIVPDEQPHPPSFAGILVILALVVGTLSFRCFQLQVTRGDKYASRAEGNSIRVVTVPAERGLVVDSSGTVLAQNSRMTALAINPQSLPAKKAGREVIYRLLKEKANIPDETLAFVEKNRQTNPDPFVIKTNIDKDENLLYREWFHNVPGIVFQEAPIRSYASLPSLGQLIGYVGAVGEADLEKGYALNQRVGKSGLEKTYESVLTGKAGKEKVEVNAQGSVAGRFPSIPGSQPVTGQTLKLTVDSRLQRVVADALQHELERRTKKFGNLANFGASAVVIDPNNGAVKAMVSLPDYDPNLFAKGISSADYASLLNNPAKPLINRTIQGTYAPGSIIKPLIASAALQEGVIKPDTQMFTPEAIYIGKFRFVDWKFHGNTNTRKAIAESNDIFFYALGGGWEEKNFKGLGIDRMNNYLRQFGLGERTRVDLPGEDDGLLANPEWKQQTMKEKWYIGDTYNASIGQGYTLTTPLQMAAATAAVANGGTLWEPHLAAATINPQTNQETSIPPVATRTGFISASNLQVVREGMRETVLSGSARPLNTLKVTSAGKTGTAQFGRENRTHAWYTGFAPYEKPEIVFAIMIEGGGDSFYSSVPVAEEILRGYFNEPLAPDQKPSASTGENMAEFQGEH